MTQTLDLDIAAFRIAPARGDDLLPASPVGGPSWRIAAVLSLVAALLPVLLWAGDVSWMNDEPLVLAHAALFNAEGIPAERGLSGSFGIEYGPVATQTYQLILLVTTDPVSVARLHGALLAGTTVVGLLWLARTLALSPWLLPTVLVAPFVVWSNRTLWDATMAVPLGTLALAAYASWLQRGGVWRLFLAAAALVLVPFCHLQGLPLFGGMLAHLLWRWPRTMSRRELLGLTGGALAALAPNVVYLVQVLKILPLGMLAIAFAGHGGSAMPRGLAPLVPLMGGRLFTAETFESWVVAPSLPGDLEAAAHLATFMAVPLVWLGIVSAAAVALKGGRRRRGAPDTVGGVASSVARSTSAVRRDVAMLSLLVLAIQAALFTLMRAPPWPQYFYGTFAVHLLLAWMGLQLLARVRLQSMTAIVLLIAGMMVSARALWDRHAYGPPRATGPTLANQADIARQLNRYVDPAVWTDVALYRDYPQAIRSLRLLVHPADDGPAPIPNARLLIRYRVDQSADRGRVELIELPPAASPPEGTTELNVTPMSRWY